MSRVRLAFGASIAIVAAPALLGGSMALMHAEQQHVTTISAAEVAAVKTPARPLIGVFEHGVFEHGVAKSYAPVTKFGQAVKSTPRLVLLFTGFGSKFPIAFAREAQSRGAHLLIQINPGTIRLSKIASGADDGWLRGYAKQVARFGHPVVIGFGHEMNGPWYPWGYKHQPAKDFIAAWRHIVRVFRGQGAANAIWLWTISHHIEFTAPLKQYWPGGKYVDWVGIDGYYYHPTETFRSVFGRKILRVRALTHKPILLSEVGIGQIAGQAAKIPGLFAGITANHLAGLVWFDIAQHGSVFKQDWRLEGHRAGLAAFRKGLAGLRLRSLPALTTGAG